MIIPIHIIQYPMQEDTSFTIVSKEVQQPNENAPSKFQEVVIRVQKEGSANLRHSGVIGRNHFSPQLETVLVQMKKGEKWTLEDQQKTKYTVQLVDLGQQVDPRSQFEQAEALKAEGNAFIKEKKYSKAINTYTEAYNFVVNDPSARAQELKLSLVSNLALAALNINEFKLALTWCDMHLEQTIDPNVKIIYRRASANKGLKNWEQARRDVRFGIEQSGQDQDSVNNFKALLAQLEKDEKIQKDKEKAVYGKMFG